MKNIVCFGDSNTFGFDPADGSRYPADSRFCDLLQEALGIPVLNLGENGRTIPVYDRELETLTGKLPCGLLVILLGTNDLLWDISPEGVSARMAQLLDRIRKDFPDQKILLLGLPPIRLPGLDRAAEALCGLYKAEAARRGLLFLDPGPVPLAFDRVHLSPEGHRLLAKKLTEYLKPLI